MNLRFGYTIFYVHDVMATLAFYEAALGLTRKFVHESQAYAELETGATTLAFASETMAEFNGVSIRPNRSTDIAAGCEIAFVCDDPHQCWDRAVAAGAMPIHAPQAKPWGQVVGYVRDLNGCLIELCSDVSAA